MKQIIVIFLSLLLLTMSSMIHAGKNSPWGGSTHSDLKYKPAKVVYDLYSGNENDFSILLDRVSMLNTLYGADLFDSSIIIVVHGSAIRFFAIDNYNRHMQAVSRAQSLTVGTAIEFHLCQANAKLMNYEPKDIHGFVKMVPMADAELVRLQQEGYAYMQ